MEAPEPYDPLELPAWALEAVAAVRSAVLEQPGRPYTLYLYGASRLGKATLLRALRDLAPSLVVHMGLLNGRLDLPYPCDPGALYVTSSCQDPLEMPAVPVIVRPALSIKADAPLPPIDRMRLAATLFG